MSERGSIEVPVSEIAERANLNGALIKYYFGSKQGLMLEVADDIVSSGIAQMQGLQQMPLSPPTKMKIHIKAIIRLYFQYPFLNRLIHAILEDEALAKHAAESITKPLTSAQRALLDEGVEKGFFRPVDPVSFYFIIVGACDQIFFGAHTLKFAFGIDRTDVAFQDRYANSLADLLFEGLLIKKDTPALNGAAAQPAAS